MTVEPGWIPPGIDKTKANIARVYDWWLGGNHNFQSDIDAARTAVALDLGGAGRLGFAGR